MDGRPGRVLVGKEKPEPPVEGARREANGTRGSATPPAADTPGDLRYFRGL